MSEANAKLPSAEERRYIEQRLKVIVDESAGNSDDHGEAIRDLVQVIRWLLAAMHGEAP